MVTNVLSPATIDDFPDSPDSPVERVSRTINRTVETMLWTQAGGRCEFRGCNKYLCEHPLTKQPGNFAEKAHIVAFRKKGPRGLEGPRPEEINGISNLMLLCRECHWEVDQNAKLYPRHELEAHKREHEDRIRFVTGLGPEVRTSVVQFTSRIGEFLPDIGADEIFDALRPKYPSMSNPTIIDLSGGLGDEQGGVHYELAAQRIREETRRLYLDGSDARKIKHLSVFALAPIPMLVAFGAGLSNKFNTDFFQCHRDKDKRWRWYDNGEPVRYTSQLVRKGSEHGQVGLLLSLSGTIDRAMIPPEIDERFSIYEITLADVTPNTGFLRLRDDLESFRAIYRGLLAEFRRDHPSLETLHLFPAVPAPVAVVCGFDLLPKVDPNLAIYDNVKDDGGFIHRMEINSHERE